MPLGPSEAVKRSVSEGVHPFRPRRYSENSRIKGCQASHDPVQETIGPAMNGRRYQLRLQGLSEDEGQITAARLRDLMDALLRSAERATRLLATGKGIGRGPNPRWLNETVAFSITGLRPGSTIIEIEAPFLRSTAREQFSQRGLENDDLDLESTSLDLLSMAIEETMTDRPAGNRFDSSVLDGILMFRKLVGNSNIRCDLVSQDPARPWRLSVSCQTCVNALKLKERMPTKSQVFIVSGKLEKIESSARRFRLLIGSGKHLAGMLRSDLIDFVKLRPLWGQTITAKGDVHFKLNGQPRMMEVHHITRSRPQDGIFQKVPSPNDRSLFSEAAQASSIKKIGRKYAVDLDELVGAWPGDETIDELMAVLD